MIKFPYPRSVVDSAADADWPLEVTCAKCRGKQFIVHAFRDKPDEISFVTSCRQCERPLLGLVQTFSLGD